MLSLERNSDSDDTLLLSSDSTLTGFPLQCVQCQSYKNGECATKKETCTTKPGETCMIRRTWYANESKYLFCALETIYFSFRIPSTISKIRSPPAFLLTTESGHLTLWNKFFVPIYMRGRGCNVPHRPET